MNRTQWSRLLPALSVALAAACDRRTDAVTISGTVEIREIRMAALASGRLDRLLKDEGDSVRRGDTIAVLVQPGLDAQIEERQARSQAAVERLSEVDAARADSERAAGDLARATPLRANGIVAAQQYDNLRSAATAASARLQSVRAAVGEASAARAAVQATRAIRDQLTVIAPDDGVILTRYAERGEAVASGAPIVSLGVVGRPWIRAYIGERVLPRVMVGQAVRVRIDGYPDNAFAGRISDISPRAEFTPRAALTERERADLVYAIKIGVNDGGRRFKAGLPVTVEVPLQP